MRAIVSRRARRRRWTTGARAPTVVARRVSTEPPLPVNPYAPSEALAHGDAFRNAQERPFQRRLQRVVAIVVAFLTNPIAGAGLYVLGRRNAFVWMICTLCVLAVAIASVFVNAPVVFLAAAALNIVITLVAIVYTVFAKPGAAPPQGIKGVAVIVLLTLAARGGALATKKWLVEAYNITSGGMIPTLLLGDHIMVAKTKRIDPGDVVVLRYPRDPKLAYAKRAVAIGGQTVEISEGVVAVDGIVLKQFALVGDCPALENDLPTRMPIDMSTCRLLRENAGKGWYSIMRDSSWSPPARRFVVPPGHLFVLGDNRDNSSDSRVWGAVPLDLVDGRAAFIWWSSDTRGAIRWDRIGRKID